MIRTLAYADFSRSSKPLTLSSAKLSLDPLTKCTLSQLF
jgi:hypothetical protein